MMKNNWTKFAIQDIVDPHDRYSLTGGPFGSDLKSSEYTTKGIRIIQLQNIGDGEFKDKYKIYTSEEKADSLSSCKIYSGEIILSKMGDPVARATLIPDHLKICLMASDGIRLKVDEKRFDKKFILEKINAPSFRSQAETVSTGTTRKRIGLQSLKELTLDIPPLPEQKKIAEIISGIDRGISQTKNYLKKLYLLREQVLLKLLKLDSSSQTLEDFGFNVFDGDRGKAYPKESDLRKNSDCLFLSAKNVTRDGFNFSDNQFITNAKDKEMRKGRLEKGDLVITTRGSLGHIAYFDDLVPFPNIRINSGMAIIRSINSRDLLKETFLKELLVSNIIQDQIKYFAFGTAQNQLTLNILRKIRIPLISTKNMRNVVNFATAINRCISSYELYFEKFKVLKKGMTSELISGRKRIKV